MKRRITLAVVVATVGCLATSGIAAADNGKGGKKIPTELGMEIQPAVDGDVLIGWVMSDKAKCATKRKINVSFAPTGSGDAFTKLAKVKSDGMGQWGVGLAGGADEGTYRATTKKKAGCAGAETELVN